MNAQVTELAPNRAGVRLFQVVTVHTVTVAPRGGGRHWDVRPEILCSCGADMCPQKMAVLSELAQETAPAA